MTTINAAHITLTAPDNQAFRAQLAFAAIEKANYPEAAELLIAAARAELDSEPDWAERAAELAQWCADQCSAQRKLLLAALLDLFGQRQGATAIDINAAVYLAHLHLDRGHSGAKALAEGRLLLKAAFPGSCRGLIEERKTAIQPTSAPRLAQASSGR